MSIEACFEKSETREIIKVPEIEIKPEKGFFLLSAMLKGYSPEWGNQDKKCELVSEARRHFEENPLDGETVDYLKSIKALEEGGIDEEGLFYLSAMYEHPERNSEVLETGKDISSEKAEDLKKGLFGVFDKLDKKLASTKLAEDYQKIIEEDIKIRQEKLPETREMVQGVIDFFRPSPEICEVEKISFAPTDLLWRQESGRINNFGKECIVSGNAEIQNKNPHEFMHTFINPITEKLRGKLTEEQEKKIIELSPGMLKVRQGYGEHWYSLLNEALIRTYTDHFSKGEGTDFESYVRRIAEKIKNEADWQEKSKNFSSITIEALKNLGINSFAGYKEKENDYFEASVRNKLADRIYPFYEKYAEAIKSDQNLSFEDYLLQNYEELVK